MNDIFPGRYEWIDGLKLYRAMMSTILLGTG